ncbi:MAG TPA: dihydrodipicolinate reductase C-terminal domain-containing protein [Gemmatimonadaceae bacterium]|jgi:4-hydroxy-tetrahydrodipicolinate reductase|nr:dihydrodipicolinate reductase C-terminal domain-containing protein [Gemmatimonadaceae bacterium]
MRVALIGMGKMGRAVRDLAGAQVAVTLDAPFTPDRLANADVAIEFTVPSAAPTNIRACLAAGCPVVVGTTGWYAELPSLTEEVSRQGGALLWAPNFSLGAQVMMILAAVSARLLDTDAAIVETHHASKKDAPSGTAREIARAIIEERSGGVPITSVRVGHVPGTHEVIFDGTFDQLRLTHEVRDRKVFAEGALVAAEWLIAEKRVGVFTMQDVLA